jgi:hypothetical protein
VAILLDAFTPGEYLLLLAALSSIHSILASRLRVLTTVVDDQGSLPGAGERNNSSIDSPEATS